MSKFSMLLNITSEESTNNNNNNTLILTPPSSSSSPSPMMNHKRVIGYDDEDLVKFQQQQELIKSPKKTKYSDEDQNNHNQHISPSNSPPLLLTKGQFIHVPSTHSNKLLYTPEYISSKVNSELRPTTDHRCPSPPLHHHLFRGAINPISPNSSSNGSHQHPLIKSRSFETTEQQVATNDDNNWIDHEEPDDDEFGGEEYDDYVEDEDLDEEDDEFLLDSINHNNLHQHHHHLNHHHHLPSHFEEMRKSNLLQQSGSSSNNGAASSTSPKKSLQIIAPTPIGSPLGSPLGSPQRSFRCVPGSSSSTPTTPKSHVGTPSRPFPTLDYKLKSESVKQNSDGTYSCPYPTCNKTIKGNKGNLSSHLRWHRRLDAEAGEARGTNNLEEGEEEEFTTPLKPSQRGVQLRNQMIHYGLNLFRQDNQGKYLCFFDGCQLRMLTNFSRHIAKHERKGDHIKPELKPFLPKSSVNNPRIPTSPPPISSASSLQSTPYLYSSQSTPNLSPLQDSLKSSSSNIVQPQQPSLKSKRPFQNLTVNVNNSSSKCSSPIGSSHSVNSISVLSPPLLSPTFGSKPISSPTFEGNVSNSPSSSFEYRKSMSTSKLEIFSKSSIISDDDSYNVPNVSSPTSSSSNNKRYLSQSQSNMSSSSSSSNNGPSSPTFLFSASSKSRDEIQWIYKKPSTPTSPPRPSPQASVVPTTPPSPNNLVAPLTPTSLMNIQFQKLYCGGNQELGSISNSFPFNNNCNNQKGKKDEVAKLIMCFRNPEPSSIKK